MDDQKSGVDTFLSTVIFGSSDPLGNLNEDDDLGTYEAPDPVAERIAAIATEHRFGKSADPWDWNEEVSASATEAGSEFRKRAKATEPEPHEDGVFTERYGAETWEYTYKNGKLVHMKVSDPDLPNSVMEFDGLGNELTAA